MGQDNVLDVTAILQVSTLGIRSWNRNILYGYNPARPYPTFSSYTLKFGLTSSPLGDRDFKIKF